MYSEQLVVDTDNISVGDAIMASRQDLAHVLNISIDELPITVFNESNLGLKTLRDNNYGDTAHSKIFDADSFIPPVKLPPPKTPSADSPYRKEIRPKQKPKVAVNPTKRAKYRIKQMLKEMENTEEAERKANQIIVPTDPLKYHLQQAPTRKKKKVGVVEELMKLIEPSEDPSTIAALSMSLSDSDYTQWRDEAMQLEERLNSDLDIHVKLPELDLTSERPHTLYEDRVFFPEMTTTASSPGMSDTGFRGIYTPKGGDDYTAKKSNNLSVAAPNRKRPRSKVENAASNDSIGLMTDPARNNDEEFKSASTPKRLKSSSPIATIDDDRSSFSIKSGGIGSPSYSMTRSSSSRTIIMKDDGEL